MAPGPAQDQPWRIQEEEEAPDSGGVTSPGQQGLPRAAKAGAQSREVQSGHPANALWGGHPSEVPFQSSLPGPAWFPGGQSQPPLQPWAGSAGRGRTGHPTPKSQESRGCRLGMASIPTASRCPSLSYPPPTPLQGSEPTPRREAASCEWQTQAPIRQEEVPEGPCPRDWAGEATEEAGEGVAGWKRHGWDAVPA